MKIVSACWAGLNVRHDGGNKANKKVLDLVKAGEAIPVCPELLAGFSISRESKEIHGSSVCSKSGEDVTAQFQKGAEEVLRIARLYNVKEAVFKAKSPSCGKGLVYDGSFSKKLIEGNGVTAERLMKNGIKVISEDELE